MKVLTIRTDNPTAEVRFYENGELKAEKVWQAHRQLAETVHSTISEILDKAGVGIDVVEGIIFYKGPGSFTGLRIGASLANALAYSLGVPIVGTSGKDWETRGLEQILTRDESVILPEYGNTANITPPRK